MITKILGMSLILSSIYCMSATLLHKGDAYVQVAGAILISFYLLLAASGSIKGKEAKPSLDKAYHVEGEPGGRYINVNDEDGDAS